MKHIKSKEKFLGAFKEKYPNYKIIEFVSVAKPIIVEDKDGIRYKKNHPFNALKHGFNVQSIIDKTAYIENKIKSIFPNLSLIEYSGIKEPVVVEDDNGFRYNPQCYDLINGSIVSIKTCLDKEGLFKFKANNKHNDFYDYSEVKYVNGKTKVKIICKIHGDFKQIPESHLFGHGCPKCAHIGFSKESRLKKLKNKTAYFYVLEVYNNDEKFIKIGITSKTINERYRNLKNYKYKILTLKERTPSQVYDMEKKLLKELKNFKVLPKLSFEGWTECFSIKCVDIISKHENNNDFRHP